ncbi:hypothetical protein QYF36_012463 [Acer negundo]|nr:hypothetical protein QYF36_012463 [Acer negundo]
MPLIRAGSLKALNYQFRSPVVLKQSLRNRTTLVIHITLVAFIIGCFGAQTLCKPGTLVKGSEPFLSSDELPSLCGHAPPFYSFEGALIIIFLLVLC